MLSALCRTLVVVTLGAAGCSTGDPLYVLSDAGTDDQLGADQRVDQGSPDVLPVDLTRADQDQSDILLPADGPLPDSGVPDLLPPTDTAIPPDTVAIPDATWCGNGQVDSPVETCDKAIAPGEEGACPQGCDDDNICTQDSLQGSVAACTAACLHEPIPQCCGNGIEEGPEQCDDGNRVDRDGCSNGCLLPGGHLLLTEVAVSPSDAEFVELYNPATTSVALDSVYLSDRNDYFNVPAGSVGTSSGFDFTVRFPPGATIGPGQHVVVALGGSLGFKIAYGKVPDYELKNTEQSVPDMVAATAGSLGSRAGLTDDGELIMLFSWDGASDRVADLDYLVWKGSTPEAVYKSPLICVDGPDPDLDGTCYLEDTPVTSQRWLSPTQDGSLHRCDHLEGTEAQTGGNGATGHDETSEPFDLAGATWKRSASFQSRTPGEPAPLGFCPQ